MGTVKLLKLTSAGGTQGLRWMGKVEGGRNKEELINGPPEGQNPRLQPPQTWQQSPGCTGLGYSYLFILKHFQTYGER